MTAQLHILFIAGLFLLFPSLLTGQGKKLHLEVTCERLVAYSLGGLDSLILTAASAYPDSLGIYQGNIFPVLVVSRQGLRVGGDWHPTPAIESLTVAAFFGDSDSSLKKTNPLGGDDRVGLSEPAVVSAGEYLKGNLIAIGGDALVEGEVGGDVVVFMGNGKLGPEAVVHGDVVVFGGKLNQKDGAVIGGRLARECQESYHKQHRNQLEFKLFCEGIYGTPFTLGLLNYNRVDGFNSQAAVSYVIHNQRTLLFAAGGHAFSRNRWLYLAGVSHELFDRNRLWFGATVHRQTWSQDDWTVGYLENTFATLFMRADFKDYVEREGVSVFAQQEYKKPHTLRLGFSLDQFRALNKQTDWSILRGPRRFRENFSTLPVDTTARYQSDFNSEISALTLRYTFDTRPDGVYSDSGWYGKAEWELAGGAFGRERDYSRIILTLVRIQPLGPKHTVLAHAKFGTSIHRLPLQKLFFLGGIGTLRGYRFKEFYGDRMTLLNLEHFWRFIDAGPFSPTGVLFFDLGKTSLRSADPDFWSGETFRANFGIGIKFGGLARFDLAKALESANNPARFTFRGERNF